MRLFIIGQGSPGHSSRRGARERPQQGAVRALVAFAALRGMPPERVVAHFELGDGLVSCLRAYTERELHDLAKGCDDGYGWEFVVFRKGPAKVTAFIGAPK